MNLLSLVDHAAERTHALDTLDWRYQEASRSYASCTRHIVDPDNRQAWRDTDTLHDALWESSDDTDAVDLLDLSFRISENLK